MAIDFLGVDEVINCGSGASLDNLATKTVALWVYLDSYGEGDGFFVCKATGASSDTGWHLYASDTNDTLRYQHGWSTSASSRAAWVSANDSCPVGAWRHVAVTYDRGATGNDPIFYVNGVLSATTEITAPSGTVIDESARSLYIGNEAGTTRTMDGRVEDVRVFNRILSADEVAILANGYRGPLGGEVGWWPMLGAKGLATWDATTVADANTIRDESGNGNTGTPAGSPVGIASDAPRLPAWIPTRLGNRFFTQATAYRMRHWRRGRDMSDSVSEQIT